MRSPISRKGEAERGTGQGPVAKSSIRSVLTESNIPVRHGGASELAIRPLAAA